jgi:Dolichyl-phosphate-mannose-protein mannosyltransferase
MILSAFTHLWNPIGFPGVHYDEAIYMERGMRLLEGLGPQDPVWRYDHPFFGQFFLAGLFKILGYPESVNPNPDAGKPSIEGLYFVPRAIMGILAVIDTFLVYKIGEYRYGRKVAIVSSILFAVMPLSWLVRRIFLESILLPFLLLSILLAVYSGDTRSKKNKAKMISPVGYNNILIVLLSGISLGIAIFTKIPAFALIPLVGFLIFKNNKNLRLLALWFIPVILIPLIWPIYAFSIGELDKWFDVERGVLYQVHRASRPLQDSVSVHRNNWYRIRSSSKERSTACLMVFSFYGVPLFNSVFFLLAFDYFVTTILYLGWDHDSRSVKKDHKQESHTANYGRLYNDK